MARKRRLHKRYGKKRSSDGGGGFKRNPPILADLAEFIGPGFAAFAATRFLTRIAAVQLARKKPSWGKHAGAITSIASFVAAWFGAHRVKVLEKYHTPIVVGSAIAALQSIIQLYIPKLGWMLADASPQLAEELGINSSVAAPNLPPGVEVLDEDPNLYTYNDSYDNGRVGTTVHTAAKSQAQKEDELLSDLNLDDTANLDVNLGSLGV